MADIKDSVVSVETAERLHKAGVIIDSSYSWFRSSFPQITEYGLYPSSTQQMVDDDWSFVTAYHAPTACEIWDILPDHIKIKDLIYFLEAGKNDGKTYVIYGYMEDVLYRADHEKLCEALADLITRLKEGGYINE